MSDEEERGKKMRRVEPKGQEGKEARGDGVQERGSQAGRSPVGFPPLLRFLGRWGRWGQSHHSMGWANPTTEGQRVPSRKDPFPYPNTNNTL